MIADTRSILLKIGCGGCPGPIPTCSVEVESKSGFGFGSAKFPCGFVNPEDGFHYLERVTSREITLKNVSPAPTPMSCHTVMWECAYLVSECGTGSAFQQQGKVKTNTTTNDFEYTKKTTATFQMGEEACSCGVVDTEIEEGSYSIDVVSASPVFSMLSTDCETGPLHPGCPAGTAPCGDGPYEGIVTGPIQEIDEDITEITYNNQWSCSFDVVAEAEASLEDSLAAAEWTSGVPGGFSQATDSTNPEVPGYSSVTLASATSRFHITGNSGYVAIYWDICDGNNEPISSGSDVVEWTAGEEVNLYVNGPSTPVPPIASDEEPTVIYMCNLRYYCTPEAEAEGES